MSEEVVIFGDAAGTYIVDSLIDGPTGDENSNFVAGVSNVDGGAGDDFLVSGELKAGNGQQTGKYTITKAGEPTTFQFDFDIARAPTFEGYAAWALSNMGITVGDNMTQNDFSKSYTAWLNALVDHLGIGSDLDGDGKISVGLNQNDPNGTPIIEGLTPEELDALFGDATSLTVKTGKVTQERWFSDLEAGGGFQILGDDGNDTILNFDVEGAGHDILDLSDVTLAEALEHFQFTKGDFNNDGHVDTMISWGSGSITLLDVNSYAGLQQMYDDGMILFG